MSLDHDQLRRLPDPAEPDWTDEESAPPVKLLFELDRQTAAACVECTRALCGHEVLFSVAAGLKNSPRCLKCLADGLRRPVEDVREQFGNYVQGRECYRKAWDIACDRENLSRDPRPSCLWSGDNRAHSVPAVAMGDEAFERVPLSSVAEVWDAEDMSCGDLVLELRQRLNKLAPASVLKVTAFDPAAPEDIPAWCRLTGQHLAHVEPPHYYIQRKDR